jgi:hypothetical protein
VTLPDGGAKTVTDFVDSLGPHREKILGRLPRSVRQQMTQLLRMRNSDADRGVVERINRATLAIGESPF